MRPAAAGSWYFALRRRMAPSALWGLTAGLTRPRRRLRPLRRREPDGAVGLWRFDGYWPVHQRDVSSLHLAGNRHDVTSAPLLGVFAILQGLLAALFFTDRPVF